MPDEDECHSETREYASPACYLHEFAPGYGIEPAAPKTAPAGAPIKQSDASLPISPSCVPGEPPEDQEADDAH